MAVRHQALPDRRAGGADGEEPGAPQPPAVGERSISVSGDLGGIASSGDNAYNIQVRREKE
jgi:hypothetical protein